MAKTLAERLRDCAQGVRLGADGMGWSPDPALLEEAADKFVSLHADLLSMRCALKRGNSRMREDNERLREALEAVLAWGTDENFERARAACSRARIVLRTTGADPSRPPTPVGWSDTDWLAHLEQLQQNEAAYAKGPLPERGWD